MINSMTAFGRAKVAFPGREITVELRSVNSRFFDCTVRLPRRFLAFEDRIRSYVREHAVARAKVEVALTLRDSDRDPKDIQVDMAYVRGYLTALRAIGAAEGLRDDLSLSDLAPRADLFLREAEAELPTTEDWEQIRTALDEAFSGYTAMRRAEGERLIADIRGKLSAVSAYVDCVEQISREEIVGYRDRFEARLRALLADTGVVPDEGRILTECGIYADKVAIDEEIVRLRSHIAAFHDIVALPEPSGRKLDFLMQELNRETNTIGSKANNARIARIVVDIKGELEKMREQIQNIE